jgi:hypothetical protein
VCVCYVPRIVRCSMDACLWKIPSFVGANILRKIKISGKIKWKRKNWKKAWTRMNVYTRKGKHTNLIIGEARSYLAECWSPWISFGGGNDLHIQRDFFLFRPMGPGLGAIARGLTRGCSVSGLPYLPTYPEKNGKLHFNMVVVLFAYPSQNWAEFEKTFTGHLY